MELRDVEEPQKPTTAGEVILRFEAGAICGSDLPFFCGSAREAGQPLYGVPGRPMHEVVGTVIEPGDSDLNRGQRVVGWANGKRGLMEYLPAHAANLVPVSADLGNVAATMIQPLACVLYAVERLHLRVPGRRAAVIGQGPLGLLFSHVLRSKGARHVTGVDLVDRSDVRSKFGVHEVIWDSAHNWAKGLGEHERPEVIIEAVGHQSGALNDAISAVAAFGEIYGFGAPLPNQYPLAYELLFRKDVTLQAGTTHARRMHLGLAQKYLTDFPNLADDYFTHVLPIAEAAQAFQIASEPIVGRVKVAIQVHS